MRHIEDDFNDDTNDEYFYFIIVLALGVGFYIYYKNSQN